MKQLQLIIILLAICLNLQAKKKIKGQILFEQDTMEVTFKIPVRGNAPNYDRLQFGVELIHENGKRMFLSPKNGKEFRFKWEGKPIRMLSRKNSMKVGIGVKKYIFLRLLINDDLKLFAYYSSDYVLNGIPITPYGPIPFPIGPSYQETYFIIQKGEEELKFPNQMGFKKDMEGYFTDCPTLENKISEKEFRSNHIVEIVQFYNANCL